MQILPDDTKFAAANWPKPQLQSTYLDYAEHVRPQDLITPSANSFPGILPAIEDSLPHMK